MGERARPAMIWIRDHRFALAVVVEVLLMQAAIWPRNLHWAKFFHADQGGNLVVQELLDRGYRATVDFGYPYGLLSLGIGRVWFAILGRTPMAYQAALVVCNLLLGWAFVRLGRRLPGASRWACLGLLPLAIPTTYFNLPTALEGALLGHSLAELAAGRRSRSLVFSVLAVLCKPSLGYVVGLLVGCTVVFNSWRSPRRLLLACLPACLVYAAVAVLLGASFSFESLGRSIVPSSASSAYRYYGYGFFSGRGSSIWRRFASEPGLSVLDGSGVWLLATFYISLGTLLAGIESVRRGRRGGSTDLSACLCVGVIAHAVYVVIGFAGKWSWDYYSYLIVMALMIYAGIDRIRGRIALLLAALGVMAAGWYVTLGIMSWRTMRPQAELAGAWAASAELAEWRRVRGRFADGSCVQLAVCQGAAMLSPGFRRAEAYFLLKYITTESEQARVIQQMRRSRWVMVVNYDAEQDLAPQHLEEYAAELSRMDLAYEGRRFLVYRNPGGE